MTKSQLLLSRLFRKLKVVNKPPKANPAIYPKLREHALLKIRLNNLSGDSVHSVLMDWHVTNGTATVFAAADGTASLYLSSGGGFLGGGQNIRSYAMQRFKPFILQRICSRISKRQRRLICQRLAMFSFI
jgi:hypothetical protein